MRNSSSNPRPDINSVLRAHDQELLGLPDVVGVYIGLLDERRNERCLRVMLSRESLAARRALPKTLEGYPVVAEVSGEIRPLRQPAQRPDR